jgi:hypothetical protein
VLRAHRFENRKADTSRSRPDADVCQLLRSIRQKQSRKLHSRHRSLQEEEHCALVEITLPTDANIHAREYQLYLPSKEELQQKLEEWIEELILRQIGPGVTIQHESLPGVNMISMMQLFLSLPVISLN